jgi:hypothetical protein
MFVHEQLSLQVGYPVAQARLAQLARRAYLVGASRDAYDEEGQALIRVGPFGPARGTSRLVRVRFTELVTRGQCSHLTMRWDAVGPGGELFPALDADITIEADGQRTTKMTLDGAYRPPLGWLGAGLDRMLLSRIATVTARRFLASVADAIADPATAERASEPAWQAESGWLLPAPEQA